jgi:hypothetical protein
VLPEKPFATGLLTNFSICYRPPRNSRGCRQSLAEARIGSFCGFLILAGHQMRVHVHRETGPRVS